MVGKLRLGRANLDRMQTSGVPVLRSHNGDLQVGVVTSVRKEAMTGLWRSDWRLPKIQGNRTTFDQLDSGLMRSISVGGKLDFASIVVDNEGEVSDIDDILLTAAWELVEQSLTGIPADVAAGIDRTAGGFMFRDAAVFDLLIGIDSIRTPESTALRNHVGTLMREHNSTVATLRREEKATMTTATQIPADVLQRAVADEIARTESLKAIADVPGKLDKLIADTAAEEQRNMETRARLDSIQFQTTGQVLQMTNWGPGSHTLDVGKIIRLTAEKELGFPELDRRTSTLEESFLERQELAAPNRDCVARVPFEAIQERSRQRGVQRSSLSDAAGARPSMVTILGNAGLLFNDYSSILAAMDMKMGLRGSQKVPYFTAQGSAAGAAESADIPISTYTMSADDLLPLSIASAFDLSTSLQAADVGTFEALVDFAIFSVVNDELVAQVLDGGGTSANELAGLWGRVSASSPDNSHPYGSAQSDFSRSDILTTKNIVDLSKSDGGPGQWILGTGLYELAENTLRGGASSERYLLEDMMMENRMVHHYKDFAPASTDDAGLFVKMDRCCLLVWGDSFQLTEIFVRARKSEFKMVLECNMAVVQPDFNIASIARS